MKHLTKLMMVLVLLSGSANAFFFDTVSLTGTQDSIQSLVDGTEVVGKGRWNMDIYNQEKERYTKNSMRLSANRLQDDGFTNEFELSLDLSNDTLGLTDYTISATYTWSFNK